MSNQLPGFLFSSLSLANALCWLFTRWRCEINHIWPAAKDVYFASTPLKAACDTTRIKWVHATHIPLEIPVPPPLPSHHRLSLCLHDISAARQWEMDTVCPPAPSPPPFLPHRVCVSTCHSSQFFFFKSMHRVDALLRGRTEIVVGSQKLSGNQRQDGAAVAIVTGRSNLLFLRILIESLLSIQGGGWMSTEEVKK